MRAKPKESEAELQLAICDYLALKKYVFGGKIIYLCMTRQEKSSAVCQNMQWRVLVI